MLWSLVVVVLVSVDLGRAKSGLNPLVVTKLGAIRGLRGADGEYSVFLGVPYAKVNRSDLFGPSIPNPTFVKTFDAFDDSAICPQFPKVNHTITGPIAGTLDCLNLNIYVPDTANSSNLLPVVIWIHGGYFEIGSGTRYTTGPKYVMRHNVVVVTIQYRLGLYGFLCLDTPEYPGNEGLKDQLKALKWVKDNIDAFGGDPNSVTLIGSSAGAMSVDYHLLSHQEPLFHRVIMMSGAATTPTVALPSDRTVPLRISEELGFVTGDMYEALAHIATVDVHLVAVAASSIDFRPCPEKEFEGVERFVVDYPWNTPVPNAKKVGILSGRTNEEEYKTLVGKPADTFQALDLFADNLKVLFDFGEDLRDIERVVRHFYIGDEDVNVNVALNLSHFLSDFSFGHPVQSTIEKYLENGADGVFFYVFSYPSDRGWGCGHADENGHLFDMVQDRKPSSEDHLITDRFTTLFTNFAKYGDPTPEITELLPVKWLPSTRNALRYLDIDTNMTMRSRPDQGRMAFWELFFKAYKKYLVGYRV